MQKITEAGNNAHWRKQAEPSQAPLAPALLKGEAEEYLASECAQKFP